MLKRSIQNSLGAFLMHRRRVMAKEFAKPFYNSGQWKKCRAAYIKHRESLPGGLYLRKESLEWWCINWQGAEALIQ